MWISLEQYNNSAPVFIFITSANQFTMSSQNITELISRNFPQYSSSIQFARIHHLDLNPFPQPFNTPIQQFQNSFPNLQSTSLSSEQTIVRQYY
jgi:hypothetical protein